LTVALFYAAISIALAGLTVTVRAQQDKPTLDDLKLSNVSAYGTT